jgi:ribosomal protein S18 acetylase RimI-like enzyme
MRDELYDRGAATLVASWEAYARGSPGAAVIRSPGVAAALFPAEPARSVYNNALLDRDLGPAARAAALDAMEAAFAAAGIDRFAAWVHESDLALRADVTRRGYTLDTATRAMSMALGAIRLPPPAIELAPPEWSEYLRAADLPAGLLDAVDPRAFHVVIARLDGESVATGIAFDRDGDCGIFNVGTLPRARRRGLGTAVTTRLVHDAAGRGCRTASLQATAVAERLYAAVGFRDLGRILEYVPAQSSGRPSHTRSRSSMPSIVRPAWAPTIRAPPVTRMTQQVRRRTG